MKTILFIFLILINSYTAMATQKVWDQTFTKPDGTSTSIKNLQLAAKPTVVSFWASWCVPCIDEIKYLAKNKQHLEGIQLVLVNVDDGANQAQAQQIITSLNSDFFVASLFDTGGSFFFVANPSGELPTSYMFDVQGKFVKMFAKLDERTIHELAKSAPSATTSGWQIMDRSVMRHQKVKNDDPLKLWTNTLSVSYKSDEWSAQVNHDAMRQRKKQSGEVKWQNIEDEIGFSFIEWTPKSNQFHQKFRVGHDTLHWHDGQLFSLRYKDSTNQSSSLLGATYALSTQNLSIQAVGGEAKNRLYPVELDPTVDLSKTTPQSRIYGLLADYKLSFLTLGLGVGRFKQDDKPALGYLVKKDEQRYSLRAHFELGPIQTVIQSSQVKDKEEKAHEVKKIHEIVQMHSIVKDLKIGGFDLFFPVSLVSVLNPVDYTFVSSLLDAPFVPIDATNYRAGRLQAKIQKRESDYALGLGYIKEDSLNADGVAAKNEQQGTTTLSFSAPKETVLTTGLQKKTVESSNEKSQIVLGSISSSPLQQMHVQLASKKRNSVVSRDGQADLKDDGRSTTTRLDYNFANLLQWHVLQKLVLALSQTQQSGYFQKTSGIDEKVLNAFTLSFKMFHVFDFEAAYGQEPGGIVCSAGVCRNKSALNGYQLTSQISYLF